MNKRIEKNNKGNSRGGKNKAENIKSENKGKKDKVSLVPSS